MWSIYVAITVGQLEKIGMKMGKKCSYRCAINWPYKHVAKEYGCVSITLWLCIVNRPSQGIRLTLQPIDTFQIDTFQTAKYTWESPYGQQQYFSSIEFSFSSCIPGYYFSLADEGCVSCPPGYLYVRQTYCLQLRLLFLLSKMYIAAVQNQVPL